MRTLDGYNHAQTTCPKCRENIVVTYSDDIPGELIGACYMCQYEWREVDSNIVVVVGNPTYSASDDFQVTVTFGEPEDDSEAE